MNTTKLKNFFIGSSRVCFWACLCALPMGMVQASSLIEDAVVGENWQTVRVKEVKDDTETVRGHLLFTTDPESAGAAFRCEKNKLIALVSAEPVDFKLLLGMRFRGTEDWPVSFSLNSGEEQNEDWVQMYRGKIYMVKKLQTTRQLFELANSQGSFEFTRKYGKPVQVSMPALEPAVLDGFLQSCDLQNKYLPEMLAAPESGADSTV